MPKFTVAAAKRMVAKIDIESDKLFEDLSTTDDSLKESIYIDMINLMDKLLEFIQKEIK